MNPIPHALRNHGYSFGPQHPFIYGKLEKEWQVWNRHMGEVAFTSKPDLTLDNLFSRDYFEEMAARDECERLNCRHAGIRGPKLPVDVAAIDTAP
jgi:hypothetical protein